LTRQAVADAPPYPEPGPVGPETPPLELAPIDIGRPESTPAPPRIARVRRRAAHHPDLGANPLAELKSFRAEAEAVLAGPPGEFPAEVFAPATGR
jgi:hypothetical protein